MKKTVLWSALFTLLTTQAQAANDVPPPPQVLPTPAPMQQAPVTTAPITPNTTEPVAVPAIPAATSQSPANTAPVAQMPLNCDYKIPPETKTIDPQMVTSWTEKAIVQAFEFDPNTIDSQLQKLQACFTEQGWQGFNTAIQKSGNLEAIKSQKLTVSSQVDGKVELLETKDNQWKFTLPLQVVYQNDKEKVTQLLNIEVSVSRKASGELGIIQMIATARPETKPAESAPQPAMPTQTVTPAPGIEPTAPNNAQ